MKGVYVVPGSARWVNGCNQISNELLALTAEAENERLAYINSQKSPNYSVATSEISLVK
jgi:hypothetical protein